MTIQFIPIPKGSFLVFDPSASHLAWVLACLNDNHLLISQAGMLWTKDAWPRGKRYLYMQECINLLSKGMFSDIPKSIVTEGFFINPKQMFGSSVIPTINSFIEMSAYTNSSTFQEIGPSAWRNILKIKPVKDDKGKRDYKVPTANVVKSYISVPDQIPTNLYSDKLRNTPHDLTDALAITIALALHSGITDVKLANSAFFPFQWNEQFKKIGEEL